MKYDEAIGILNRRVFEGEKGNLIKKLASKPERYIGEFRPTKPRAKLIQNLLQSHEIRFGDALELLLRELISEMGYTNLNLSISSSGTNTLSLDQYFMKDEKHYFVEQKIRDDHDSTKKHGQMKNFEEKLDILKKEHQKKLIGIMYFVDPSFSKNKGFYNDQLAKLMDIYAVDLYLHYGQDFFQYFHHPNIWTDLIGWIKRWKASLNDFPVIDLDLSPAESLIELKKIRPLYWKKLIANNRIWEDGIIRVLFSNGNTLRLLFEFFSQQRTDEYQEIANGLLERINAFYY